MNRISTKDLDRSVARLAQDLGLPFCPSYLTTAEIAEIRRDYPDLIVSARDGKARDVSHKRMIGGLHLARLNGGNNYRVEMYKTTRNFQNGRYFFGVSTNAVFSDLWQAAAEMHNALYIAGRIAGFAGGYGDCMTTGGLADRGYGQITAAYLRINKRLRENGLAELSEDDYTLWLASQVNNPDGSANSGRAILLDSTNIAKIYRVYFGMDQSF